MRLATTISFGTRFAVLWLLTACFSDRGTNPYDPIHCNNSCQNGETCHLGTCAIIPDGGWAEAMDPSPQGIPVNTEVGSQNLVSGAFGGENIMLVWRHSTDWGWSEIHGARVSPAGQLLDPDGITLSKSEANNLSSPHIAFDGKNYLVIWEESNSFYSQIRGARVDRVGAILDDVDIEISSSTGKAGLSALAAGDGQYFVAWVTNPGNFESQIVAKRINTDGVVLDVTAIPLTLGLGQEGHNWPSVAYGSGRFLVAWSRKTYTDESVWGLRMGPDGSYVDAPPGFEIAPNTSDPSQPSATFDGTNYQVAYVKRSGIFATRIAPQGDILDAAGYSLSTNASMDPADGSSSPDISCAQGNCLAVWSDFRSTKVPSFDIFGTRLLLDATVLDPDGLVINNAPGYQTWPQVLNDGTNYFVAWSHSLSGQNADIYFKPVVMP